MQGSDFGFEGTSSAADIFVSCKVFRTSPRIVASNPLISSLV